MITATCPMLLLRAPSEAAMWSTLRPSAVASASAPPGLHDHRNLVHVAASRPGGGRNMVHVAVILQWLAVASALSWADGSMIIATWSMLLPCARAEAAMWLI